MKIHSINSNINPKLEKPKFSKVPFGSLINMQEKAFQYHLAQMIKTNPKQVESHLGQLGVDAIFRTKDEYTNKILAYCCEKTSNIFKQLNMVLPIKIDTLSPKASSMKNAIAWCNWTSFQEGSKFFPIRSVAINEKIPYGKELKHWSEIDKVQEHSFNSHHASTRHFLGTFIHEFIHNAHYHNLYSQFGCPEPNPTYVYNPQIGNVMLSMSSKDCHGYTKLVKDNVSNYGGTDLYETIAENFTGIISDEKNLDLFSLELKRNPFPSRNPNNTLAEVIYEAWNGLINDGKGLI